MIYYKNISQIPKTFHNVTFKPGEIHGVEKYIDSKFMIVVPEPVKKKEEVLESKPKPSKEVKSDGEDRDK